MISLYIHCTLASFFCGRSMELTISAQRGDYYALLTVWNHIYCLLEHCVVTTGQPFPIQGASIIPAVKLLRGGTQPEPSPLNTTLNCPRDNNRNRSKSGNNTPGIIQGIFPGRVIPTLALPQWSQKAPSGLTSSTFW